MREKFDIHRDVWGPIFVSKMEMWSAMVFQNSGLFSGKILGSPPVLLPASRTKRELFSDQGTSIRYLKELPADYESVKYFDYSAGEYQVATRSFKTPIFEHTIQLLQPYLFKEMVVLDPACGPGEEAIYFANYVTKGEVVACDLSNEMIRLAYRRAKKRNTPNLVFFQEDARKLPVEWDSHFDLVFCFLSFHYFNQADKTIENFHRVLRPNGLLIIVEPDRSSQNQLAAPVLKLANPGFVKLWSPQEFEQLLQEGGFSDFYWKEILPGIGVTMAKK